MDIALPTRADVIRLNPASCSWDELKAQVDSGDLGVLGRHPDFQKLYDVWCQDVKAKHGSIVNYIVNVRLGWGPITLPVPSSETKLNLLSLGLPTPPPTRPLTPLPYFTASADPSLVKILPNDWPYSVPHNITHYVVWSRLPLIHPGLVPEFLWPRLAQDGLWGFTGSDYVRRQLEGLSKDEMETIVKAGSDIALFVSREWNEAEYETAWFANPPRLQSVPGLAHFHVFVRCKAEED
ncbi:hypothetical protein BOTBODRAFT_26884 [Botryobasidium botryosum FD-172 SS1]|uniref:Uncharacterized protein n=1 Tax=Botryobasidium botryosum (strain FD-172 SS1) TaxID=930990 RepID=A0A067N9U6_BOTB1|nr:hypothetical protein BOTBODRAFT_26884 [Botryobasidium botryosum FD-172 SS1]